MKTEQHAAPSGPVFNSVKEVEASINTRMEKALSDLQHDMGTIRTGRASLSILDNLRVDYYGTPTPLNQVANMHVPRSEEHTSELQSPCNLVCRLLLEKKTQKRDPTPSHPPPPGPPTAAHLSQHR